MRLRNSAHISGPLALVENGAPWRRRLFPVRYGIIETGARRILVDTGYGPRVTSGRRSVALRLYANLLRPRLLPFDEAEIDTILITHFHADHMARLRDFPKARLLAARAAIEQLTALSIGAAARQAIFLELLPEDFFTRIVAVETCRRCATGTCLGDGYDIVGDGTYLAVPLPGHARGHLGLFWRENYAPQLYATDAAWTLQALRTDATPQLAQRLIFDDAVAAGQTAARLRRFLDEGGTVTLCHDPE
jgi:glyoxylase-like metal-dependent hydrolase (beta-lactamase superfamily II)